MLGGAEAPPSKQVKGDSSRMWDPGGPEVSELLVTSDDLSSAGS